jgi:hypothetical protein
LVAVSSRIRIKDMNQGGIPGMYCPKIPAATTASNPTTIAQKYQ